MSAGKQAGKTRRRKIWNIVLGIFFLILGLIGILIPVMPQVLFFVLSAIFFSRVSPRLRRALRRYRKRHPKIDRAYANWRRQARDKRQRLIRKARKLRRGFEEKVDEATGRDAGPRKEGRRD